MMIPLFMDGVDQDFFCISAEEEGARIDKLLADRYPQFSRTYFQHLLENGLILLNGKSIKKRILAEEGDEVEICFQAIPTPSLVPEKIPLEILYEDEYLLAVNKPAGMVVHPGTGNWSGTFVNALLAHCEHLAPGNDTLRPGIVHRLDKEMAALPDGREAITELQVVAFNDKVSLVLAKPRTGRTHQIRVHLKHIHAPVLGDNLYGKRGDQTRHL